MASLKAPDPSITVLTRRSFLRQALITSAAVTSAPLIAAACAPPQQGQPGGPTERAVLDVNFWSQPVKPLVDKTVPLYTAANPNAEVKVTVTPFADYWTKLQTTAAGASGPDVFWMNGPNFHRYRSAGLLLELQPLVERARIDTSKYDKAMRDLYSFEGRLYAMPYFLDSVALLYNKELFEKAGVQPPQAAWTWDDLATAARRLTDKAKGIYGYTAPIDNQWGYYPLIYSFGGHVIDEQRTRSGFDLPETRAALSWMVGLMREGVAPNGKIQLETDAQKLFSSGLAAMHPTISPRAAVVHQSLKDKLGVAELPKGARKATIVHGIGWAVNARSEFQDAAWELVRTLGSVEGARIVAESGFSIPAITSETGAWVRSLPGVDLQVFVDSLKFGFSYPISKRTPEWQEVESKELRRAFAGEQSVDEATRTLAKQMNDILAQER